MSLFWLVDPHKSVPYKDIGVAPISNLTTSQQRAKCAVGFRAQTTRINMHALNIVPTQQPPRILPTVELLWCWLLEHTQLKSPCSQQSPLSTTSPHCAHCWGVVMLVIGMQSTLINIFSTSSPFWVGNFKIKYGYVGNFWVICGVTAGEMWGWVIYGLFVYKILTGCGENVDFPPTNYPHSLCPT